MKKMIDLSIIPISGRELTIKHAEPSVHVVVAPSHMLGSDWGTEKAQNFVCIRIY